MKMTDIVTNFPPQTYSSSFFINRLGDESGSKSAKIHECAKETHQASSNLLDCFITKVFVSSAVLVYLLLLSSIPHIAETKECKDTEKVRVFKTLLDYQTNKISFNPDNTECKGNNVVIEIEAEVVMKNAFITLDSDFIFKMDLENQQIRKFEDNAFYQLTCLNDLSLYNNRIEKLTSETFEGLAHLRKLNLGDNLMKEVPEYAFVTVSNLKVLNLTRNHIALLHKQSFAGMSNLELLDLSYNDLYQIIPEAFQPFLNLQTLQLGSNEIAFAEADDWKKMKKLTILNLTDNALEKFDIAYDFAFTSTLKVLYLGKNFLTKFNARAINITLPKLRILDISENPFSCVDLELILEGLNQTLVRQIGWDDNAEEPIIGEISCNKTVEWYQKRKTRPIHKLTSPSPIVSSTKVPYPKPGPCITDNSDIIGMIHTLYWTMFWLFGFVFTYIFCDICAKTGCCRWAISRLIRFRRAPPSGDDPEYFTLNL